MPKITTYKTDEKGNVQKNNDGEKIIDRQIDNMVFPSVEKVYQQLKADEKYGDHVANLFNAGAVVKCQSLTRTALAEKNKDGSNVHSLEAVQKMGMDATIENVNSRRFDPAKAAARIAPTVQKLTDEQLAEMGLSRLPNKKVASK